MESIIELHAILIEKTGGLDGIRDKHLLDSAINAPFQAFGGRDLYPSLIDKAAQLAFSLIKNHPFQDGNKRIALASMAAFLLQNGAILTCADNELVSLGLGLADNTFDKNYLKKWLVEHCDAHR
jgi:death-on-curing protein